MIRFTAAGLSVLIHILLVIMLFVRPPVKAGYESETTPNRQRVVSVNIVPDVVGDRENMISLVSEGFKYARDERLCAGKDNTYMGIGIKFDSYMAYVIYAPEMYPAYKAGIRVGDRILNPDVPIKDGYINFKIIRNDENMEFRIKIERICYTGS